MSIRYVQGDATRPVERPAIIVHVCNDLGGWGKGFVVALSKRWPEPERAYRDWHAGRVDAPFALGEVQLVQVEPDLWVANLIGQHKMSPSGGVPPIRYPALRHGLETVAEKARDLGASLHMPRIGCGLAGGSWTEVSALLEDELVAKGLSVTVYDLPA